MAPRRPEEGRRTYVTRAELTRSLSKAIEESERLGYVTAEESERRVKVVLSALRNKSR